MARKQHKPQAERTIAVVFYRFRREVKSIKFVHLDSACRRCFGHVETNRYQATTAEVINMETGKIYLTIYISVDGNLFAIYGNGARQALKRNQKIMIPQEDDEV